MKKLMQRSIAVGLLLLAGCATHPARELVQSGFLTRYDQLHKVDETTSRYVDTEHLRIYKKFWIQPVQVLVQSFNGKPVTEGERMAAEYVVIALIKALSDRYSIVSGPGADVGA